MKFSKAEIDAVIAASPRTFVPFNKLVLSKDHQARGQGGGPQLSIIELAASIKESGVLQNLIVVRVGRGLYEVCAGGRRLAAMARLVRRGDIPENYPVPVLIVPADKALIASLSENCFHVPMHPADEYVAFARLIGQKKSVEDVAAAFGVTPLVVKRRMKLASVSPNLMVQFRENQIGLDCLMVLASIDDHERQEQAWAGLSPWNRHPDQLRQLLTQGEIESDRDPVARYVTLKAYEKAGGALRRDLFSDDEKKAYLLDTPLLERLAIGKLQKRAKALQADGWKWIEVRARYVYDEFVSYGELRQTRREPNEEEAARLAVLETKLAELLDQIEALAEQEGENDDCCRLERGADAASAQISAAEAALSVWPEDLMAQAGCVVYVDNQGAAAVKWGLVRPEDRAEVAQAARQAEENGTGSPLLSLPSSRARPVHSEKLMRQLTAHRVVAVQAELIDRVDVALAALTAQLAREVFRTDDHLCGRSEPFFALTATDSRLDLRSAAADVESSTAWMKMQAERAAWAERLPTDPDAMFPWLLDQDEATVKRLLTFVVAVTATGIRGDESGRQNNDMLANALGLDMRKWWRATGPSYFNHVSRSRILDVVTEAAGANVAAPLASLKKEAVVAAAEQALAAVGWLPPCLRAPASVDGICEHVEAFGDESA